MRLDFLAIVLLLPCFQVTVELVEYPLQALQIKPCGLPQLGRGGLDERMRIRGIVLAVLTCLNVETESRADKRPTGFRVRISRQHPAFVPAIPEYLHQALQAELIVVIREFKQ